MHFYKRKQKQVVDFTGDFIITHNESLVTAQVPGAAPRYAENATYIADVSRLSFSDKLRCVWRAARFIFGPCQALDPLTLLEVKGKPLHPDTKVRINGSVHTVGELRKYKEHGWTDEAIIKHGELL